MIEKIVSEFQKIWNSIEGHGESSNYSPITLWFLFFLAVWLIGFCALLDERTLDKKWLVFVFLASMIIFALVIVFTIRLSIPYLMKKMEHDRNRENKVLSMMQEEYEQDRLAEKTRIGIIEKFAKANIEEKARDAESHRQLDLKQQDYNTKIADIISEIYKAYCSVQGPQALNNQQIVTSLIQLLTNNK